ncbi:MAG: hypothetical protein MRY75_17905 [Marivita sp.]|uniref:hypothetical protein n=1 Tax=Marivita sp. TaxID=2003365 RepID=UPI0025C6E03C|nr:hypothetical protein [Marivita sp.]MCI5112423.1 hypothetical protein [Marivita sp.]
MEQMLPVVSSRTLQGFWCASFEESRVFLNIAGHPDVVNFKEQFTIVPFENLDGSQTFTRLDAHLLFRDGREVLVSVKYDANPPRTGPTLSAHPCR